MTTAVFVHGVPETALVWGPLLAELDHDDVVTLSPPGFGAPVPEGFAATADAYADWLIAQIEQLGRPVDLVGHDWGGGHVVRVAMARPDLLRSWCTDVAGVFAPGYVWHDLAQAWQTPGAGERAVADRLAMATQDRAAAYQSVGMTAGVALGLAVAYDVAMTRCILTLYRSAAQPVMEQIGADLPKAAARPGLAIIASADPYTGGDTLARNTAVRANAKVAVLEGLGHWWMLENPHRGATALQQFWATLS